MKALINLTLVFLFILFILFIFSACRGAMMNKPDSRTVPVTAVTPGAADAGSNINKAQVDMDVVVIQGIFDPAGEKLLELKKPICRYQQRSGSIPSPQQGRFVVQVNYLIGEPTIILFDALVADDSGRTVHGFFEVEVPVRGEIVSIFITDASGKTSFARINGSEIRQCN